MLEQHHDTEEDEPKIKKQMAQFMANAVAQVHVLLTDNWTDNFVYILNVL